MCILQRRSLTVIPFLLYPPDSGDFNIKPNEPVYEYLTTGAIDTSSPFYPSPKNGMDWKPTMKPMRSAYAVKNGKEPDFTNYAQSRGGDPFIDTLDFIFLSEEWSVEGVMELAHRTDSGGPFPNLEQGESSDHLMIASSLTMKS